MFAPDVWSCSSWSVLSVDVRFFWSLSSQFLVMSERKPWGGCPKAYESQNTFKTIKIFPFFTKPTIIYPIYPNNATEKAVIHMKHIRKTLKHPKKYLYSHEQRPKSNIKALKNLTSQFFQVHPDLPLIVRHVPTILTTPMRLCPRLWSQNLVQSGKSAFTKMRTFPWVGHGLGRGIGHRFIS